jgi:hypothetical protein
VSIVKEQMRCRRGVPTGGNGGNRDDYLVFSVSSVRSCNSAGNSWRGRFKSYRFKPSEFGGHFQQLLSAIIFAQQKSRRPDLLLRSPTAGEGDR